MRRPRVWFSTCLSFFELWPSGACPREVDVIWIEFVICWNLHQLKGCPTLTYINQQVFRRCPPLTFHQPHPWKPLGWWKVRGGHPFRLMQILMVQMTKNLVHSFYDILYQSKGVPTPSHNFSRTWGTYFPIGHILLGTIYHALKSLISIYEKTKDLIFY